MFDNASWAEIVFCTVALLGLIANLTLLRMAVLDIRRLRQAGKNGPRIIVARGNRRHEAYRVLIQVALLYFGLVALSTPSPPDGPSVSVLGVLSAGVLIVMVALIVMGSVLDLRDRHELIRQVDALEEERDMHRKARERRARS